MKHLGCTPAEPCNICRFNARSEGMRIVLIAGFCLRMLARRDEAQLEMTLLAVTTADHFGERGIPVDWFPIENRADWAVAGWRGRIRP